MKADRTTAHSAHGDAASNPLPREIAPSVYWLGRCSEYMYQGRLVHAYNSAFLVCGDKCSAMIEAGLTADVMTIESQLSTILDAGAAPLRYVFLTHGEIPHAGGVGRLLEHFPDTVACGDVTDLHLVFPAYADRMRMLHPGDRLDLGGRQLEVHDAVFKDLISSRWVFDTHSKVLFAGDGFAYSHFHDAGQCGQTAEEASTLDIPDMVAMFALAAFFWTQFVDLEPHIRRLDELVFDQLDATMIAPTHGLPIGDPQATMPLIHRGLRLGSEITSTATPFDLPIDPESISTKGSLDRS